MRVGRLLAAGAALLLTIWLALPAGAVSDRADCGTERWTVKTLQDRPALLPVQATTIAALIARPKPSPLPGNRVPFERHQFRVTAQVVRLHNEDDGDIHLVLQDAVGHTMIAEASSASCNTGATATRRQQMAQARAAVKVCGKAQITRVAFFDFDHGQDGVAPNAIELHPVLGFKCLSPYFGEQSGRGDGLVLSASVWRGQVGLAPVPGRPAQSQNPSPGRGEKTGRGGQSPPASPHARREQVELTISRV